LKNEFADVGFYFWKVLQTHTQAHYCF